MTGCPNPKSCTRGQLNGLPSNIQGGSRMRESRTYGSVRGALSNGRPYRDRHCLRMRSSADLLNVGSRAMGGYVHLRARCCTTNTIRDLALEQSAVRLGWDGYSMISSALAKIDC